MIPAPATMAADVLAPGEGMVRVIGHPHPLKAERVIQDMPAGLTVAEMVAAAFPDRAGRPLALYLVGDGGEALLAEEVWDRVRPKPGTMVAFRAMLHGKSVFQIGVAVAAIAAAIAVPFILPAIGITVGAVATSAIASLVATGVTVGGALLGNVLFPVRPTQQLQEQTQSGAAPTTAASIPGANGNTGTGAGDVRRTMYSLAGAQNQARPFGTIPVILGTHRISPLYAAPPYTEIVGDDQYLRLLFCWGYGPLQISDLKIGETPLNQFRDYQIQTIYGYPGETLPKLYPGGVHQEDLQIELLASVSNTRATEPDADGITVDVTAPSGVFAFDKVTGQYNPFEIIIGVYLRSYATGVLTRVGQFYFARSIEATRQGQYFPTGVRGQYDVILIRETADGTDPQTIHDKVYWTALRSYNTDAPVQFDKPLALTALRIRASDQLSGVINTFNGVVTSIASMTTGLPSNKPAELFQEVLQGPANKRPVPTSQIDTANLAAWQTYCAANGFTFNEVRESATSVWETLSDIAAAGRAVPTFRDGKWGVIWDDPDASVVQHFTPRNSSGFSAQRTYKRMPHGLRARFINAEKGWQQDERIVYDDGYDASNASLFEGVEFPGVTDPELIWKHGRYHIAQARLRPEVFTLTTDFEHLRCTRGDRVRVTHDVPLWGQVSARVKEIVGQVVTLDEIVTGEPGREYAVRFRLSNGASLLRSVEPFVGETREITLSNPSGGPVTIPAVGDLAMFGESGKESVVLRVLGIAHQGDLQARLTLVDDAPEIAAADTGAIPAYDSHISDPVDPFALPPVDLSVQELVEGSGGAKTATVRLSWKARVGNVRVFEAQVQDPVTGVWGDTHVVAPPQTYADFRNILLGLYSFRVRSRFENGAVSDWATLPLSRITGVHLSSPLANVANLRTAYIDGIEHITWDEIKDFREVFYEVRKGDTWETALSMGRLAHPPFAVPGNGLYWISAVSQPIAALIVHSAAPSSIAIQGALLTKNVIASFDERADGWNGTFEGDVSEVAGGFIATSPGGSGYYQAAQHVDVGRLAPCPVTVTWKGTGSPAAGDFLADPDILANPDILGAASSVYADVYPEISIGLVGGDIYALPDVYATPDIYSDLITWDEWRKFTPGTYYGRFFRFRLVLSASREDVIAVALEFGFTVDVPDRIDHWPGLALPAGGQAIKFRPNGSVIEAPFNGGPNGSSVPYVNVTILDAQAGDVLQVSGLTKAGATLQILNGGAGVARTVNADFQGY